MAIQLANGNLMSDGLSSTSIQVFYISVAIS